ncbi:chorismate synthase [Inconstantimicrobium porci]|uniref:Chorismate synthase n=1 Tax=Inconstantimicrobium porci TaxID=2652291 RepID=A0A7X2MWW0_9CLOT|nr:chorismate synthase [Inconstantimicrobium porci]MDD6769503.1 chorismate synthase [Inconstantimicrobium porci]MSR90561.1 chorismate synthase [Inconstantimicrobium porci]
MSGFWGSKIKLSIFGESHGEGIGITIDGLQPGFKIDFEKVQQEMDRRAPGRNSISTARKEGDKVTVMSGIFNGVTTGTPLCGIIRNEDKKSRDYSTQAVLMRPGHGDYPGYLKYNGFNDYRGGGHFSGRITAPLVFAGAIAKQMLLEKNIKVYSHIKSISNIYDDEIDLCCINEDKFENLKSKEMAVLNDETMIKMKNRILEVKEDCDSVGGVIECIITGVEGGIGDPFFDSVESTISHLVFSVPAVKGIEFGKGFDITKMTGSKANDQYYYDSDKVKTYTNNNGGITGGITNGMNIVFRVAIKPTPSIYKEQNTINIKEKKNDKLKIVGRHDPCIVQRAVPVIEAVAAIALYDLIKE